MVTADEISQEQFEILYECERMKEEDKEPVIVSQRAIDAFREVHEEALRARGVSDPASLPFEALAGQFTTLEKEELEETVTALSQSAQQPTTGGVDPDDLSGSEPQRVSAEDRAEAREALATARKVEGRLPAHCEALREEAAELLGRSVDDLEDIDLETL